MVGCTGEHEPAPTELDWMKKAGEKAIQNGVEEVGRMW